MVCSVMFGWLEPALLTMPNGVSICVRAKLLAKGKISITDK